MFKDNLGFATLEASMLTVVVTVCLMMLSDMMCCAVESAISQETDSRWLPEL
jgi:hypothetical protein